MVTKSLYPINNKADYVLLDFVILILGTCLNGISVQLPKVYYLAAVLNVFIL